MVIKSKSSIELHNIENSFERKKHVWFSGMDKLDTLNLNNNKIEELGPRFFEGDSSHNLESNGFAQGCPGSHHWSSTTTRSTRFTMKPFMALKVGKNIFEAMLNTNESNYRATAVAVSAIK